MSSDEKVKEVNNLNHKKAPQELAIAFKVIKENKKLQINWNMLTLHQFSKSVVLYMQDTGPQGPKHRIFDDQFYLKNGRKLRFHVFLQLENIWYYNFIWYAPNAQGILDIITFFWGSLGIHDLEKFTISCENYVTTCFLAWKWRNTWNLSFLAYFL